MVAEEGMMPTVVSNEVDLDPQYGMHSVMSVAVASLPVTAISGPGSTTTVIVGGVSRKCSDGPNW